MMKNCPTVQEHHDAHPPKIEAMVQSRIDDINDITRELVAPESVDIFTFMSMCSQFNMLSKSIENLTGTKFESYVKQNPDKFRI